MTTPEPSPTRPDSPGEAVPVAHRITGDGPLLLLLAGTGYAGSTWGDALVGRLAQHFSVVTMDYRGTGATPGTPTEYSTRLFAADARALLRDLHRGPAHVLGHSMGGRVAQWVALDEPDAVRRLVLAASGPGPIRADLPHYTGIPPATCLTLVEKGYQQMMSDQIRATFFTPEFAAEDPATVQWLIDAFWQGRPQLPEYLKHVCARQGHDTVARVGDIGQPTLVLVGDRDTHTGGTGSHLEQSGYLADHLPDADFQLVPGGAHGYLWSHPDLAVPRIVSFLGVDA